MINEQKSHSIFRLFVVLSILLSHAIESFFFYLKKKIPFNAIAANYHHVRHDWNHYTHTHMSNIINRNKQFHGKFIHKSNINCNRRFTKYMPNQLYSIIFLIYSTFVPIKNETKQKKKKKIIKRIALYYLAAECLFILKMNQARFANKKKTK